MRKPGRFKKYSSAEQALFDVWGKTTKNYFSPIYGKEAVLINSYLLDKQVSIFKKETFAQLGMESIRGDVDALLL